MHETKLIALEILKLVKPEIPNDPIGLGIRDVIDYAMKAAADSDLSRHLVDQLMTARMPGEAECTLAMYVAALAIGTIAATNREVRTDQYIRCVVNYRQMVRDDRQKCEQLDEILRRLDPDGFRLWHWNQ